VFIKSVLSVDWEHEVRPLCVLVPAEAWRSKRCRTPSNRSSHWNQVHVLQELRSWITSLLLLVVVQANIM